MLLLGCSAANTLSLRDAETLPPGEPAAGGGFVLVPDLYAVHDKEGQSLRWTLDPALVGQIRQGVTDDIDIGGTIWASNLPFFSLMWGSFDLGVRAEGMWMVTGRDSRGKLAVGLDAGGYGTGVGALSIPETPHRGVGLIALAGGGLLYSHAVGASPGGATRTTLTVSFKATFASGYFQFDPTASDSAAGNLNIERRISNVMLLPSLAVRLSGGLVIEAGGMGVKSPWTHSMEWTAHGGLAIAPEN